MFPDALFLAAELPEEAVREYLASLGFSDPERADSHLQLMADELPVRLALGGMAAELMDSLSRTPDPDAALLGLERYLATRSAKVGFLGYLREDPKALDLLLQVLGTSPFLGEILIRNPEYFHWLCREFDRPGYEPEDFRVEAEASVQGEAGPAAALDALKRFRRREVLRIAARDFLKRDSVESATRQLSDLADAILEGVLKVTLAETALPGRFCVIGMGKLGGRELNYSSDIDLIYVYEAPSSTVRPMPASRGKHAERRKLEAEAELEKFARALTRTLTDYTSEGGFYRVDLRLRPMGKGGKIAYSLEQSGNYYEAWGETFERFALIKARVVAGDRDLGRRFLERVQPFVYRKYLDEAALEEMVRLKARIDAAAGGEDDVKTGRGGIREIELFTQILQILYGGALPGLRGSNTLTALAKLLEMGLISDDVHRDLQSAYVFLRDVEHRLQIVQERQIHSLPDSEAERRTCARRMGFESTAEFEAALQRHRDRVHGIYSGVLHETEEGSRISARHFMRLLGGEIPKEETLQGLRENGFVDPEGVLAGLLALDEAPSFAHSPSAARNLLSNLAAAMISELVRCAQPDRVLLRMAQAAAGSGAASSFFRSLLENDLLRSRILAVLDSGELLSQRLIQHPELLEALAEPSSQRDVAERDFVAACNAGLKRITGEDDRDGLRRCKRGMEFRILARWVEGGNLEQCHRELSLLADCCVLHAARRSAVAGSRNRREAPGRETQDWAIIALGKLGSLELTAHSDLDLVFFYQPDPTDSGQFMRQQDFAQRVQHFLESPTGQGYAYRVDTRLRPEGTKGSLAVPAPTFDRYLEGRAEIWERLAWTRARRVAGSVRVASRVLKASRAFVYGPWNPEIPTQMHAVRSRMERELADDEEGSRLDFKVGPGGLADIDFATQMVQIRTAATEPDFRDEGTHSLLGRLARSESRRPARWLPPQDAAALADACEFLRRLELAARIESDSRMNSIPSQEELLEPLGRRMHLAAPAGSTLLARYRDTTSRVRQIYEQTLERLRG